MLERHKSWTPKDMTEWCSAVQLATGQGTRLIWGGYEPASQELKNEKFDTLLVDWQNGHCILYLLSSEGKGKAE